MKHEENYTTEHNNQITQKKCKEKILKAAKGGENTLYTKDQGHSKSYVRNNAGKKIVKKYF